MKEIKITKYLFVISILVIVAVFILLSNRDNSIVQPEVNVASVGDILESSSSAIVKSNKISVVIGGDVMFDRSIRVRGEKNGYEHFFDNIKSFFEKADLAVVNLEGPITNNKTKTILKDGTYSSDLKFTFATSTAKTLRDVGIDVVSFANNHTDNTGYNGFSETKKWLDLNGVDYFGSPWNSSSTEAVFEINGIKVAFVGYHYFLKGLGVILNDVSRLKKDGYFVIVMPHWGEEYKTSHLPIMEEIAQKMVDAGADAIIGSHPHVVMDHEWIGRVPVFYSLGNLLFDQYFSSEVKRGNIIRLNIEKVDSSKDFYGRSAKIDSVDIFDVIDYSKENIGFSEASSTVEYGR